MTCVCSAVPQEAQRGSSWPGSVDKPPPQFPSWCLPQSSGSSSRLTPPRGTSASGPGTCSQVRRLTELLSSSVVGVIVDVDHCHGAECGGLQTGGGGRISSPNYPESYPSPSRCAWLLEAPAGHTITVGLRPCLTCLAAGAKPEQLLLRVGSSTTSCVRTNQPAK